jgi:hypothetical protein
MKKFLLITATLVAFSAPVSAEICPSREGCATDGDTMTLHGTVVKSMSYEDGTMKPKKVMDIALYQPLCMSDQAEQYARVELSPISKKWVGHDVAITGTIGPSGFGMYLNVKRITDDKEDRK